MPDRTDMRVLDGIDDTLRDPVAGLVLAVVDGGDDPVGFLEHVVGQVHRAVFQNVHFDALEDRDPIHLGGQLVDGFPMLPQTFGVEPLGHGDALGVIGDGDVGVAALLGGGDHFCQRGPAIGRRRVHVQVAAQVLQLQ